LAITTILWAGIPDDENAPFYLVPAVRIARTLLYIFGALVLVRTVDVAADTIRHRFETGDQLDNLTERKILTQLEYLQRIAIVVIGVVAIAFILLQFEGVRSLGQGILASAGITGIIVGLAAQKSIGNLLAGFQIAFTQPIRVDDKLIINGEFGVVEEITLTYVVLKLWDERRLIVPLQYFLDTPFQNWTHTSSNLVGTILLYVDYSFPVDALRQELDRYLETREDWDGKVNSVQLTDITDKVMQVRVLASGKDSGATFGLRCAVREHLMGFIQREHPGSLPKVRTDSPAV
jgi:small-conductance mechanosensitive channel